MRGNLTLWIRATALRRRVARRCSFAAAVCLFTALCACSHPAPTPGPAPPGSASDSLAHVLPARVPTAVALDWKAFPILPDLSADPKGRTIHVGTDSAGGNGSRAKPFKTIAAALAASARGDRIVVKGGQYPEGAADGFIALEIAAGRGGVTLVSEGGRAVVTPAHAGITYGLDIGASDVAVLGFDFVGFSSSGVVLGNPGTTARNLVLANVDVTYDGDAVPNGIAMLPDNGGDDVVDGVLLHNVRVRGASIGVQCNTGPCRNLRFEDIEIRGAEAGSNSGYDGLAVESGDNILILGAEVTGASADGIDIKGTRVAVVNAFVHHVGRNGIKLWRGGDIINSVVSHTGADTSVSLGTGDYRIVHSVVAYHNWRRSSSYSLVAAYEDATPSSVQLINSVFYRNSGGMYFGPGTRVSVDGCLFSDIENGNLFEVTTKARKRVSLVLADIDRLPALGLGDHNLKSGRQPGFRDSGKADYRLGRNSALVDAGMVAADVPVFDLAWGARVQGKAPDIGAYEAR